MQVEIGLNYIDSFWYVHSRTKYNMCISQAYLQSGQAGSRLSRAIQTFLSMVTLFSFQAK